MWYDLWSDCKIVRFKDMEKKKLISLNENDLLKVEQIVLDRDKEGALDFVKEVIKRQVDRENVSKMKRENI
jgi:hypothetical protein